MFIHVWIYPRTITVMPNMYKRKACEAFETNRLKILNETHKPLKYQTKKMVTASLLTAENRCDNYRRCR